MESRSRLTRTALAAIAALGVLSSAGQLPGARASGPPAPGNAAIDPALPPGAALVGTVVVEGGRSFALLSYAGATWRLVEGEELVEGVRLKRVRADRIVLESAVGTREIPFASGTSGDVAGTSPAGPDAPQVLPGGQPEGDVLDWVIPKKREAAEKSLLMKERRMRFGRGIQVPEDAPPPSR